MLNLNLCTKTIFFNDYKYIYELFSKNLDINVRYSLLFRVCYERDDTYTEYKMLGEQLAFYYEFDEDLLDNLKGLHNIFLIIYKLNSY
jgi:hypothetical protein